VGVVVGTATEHKSIEMLKGIDDDVGIAERWDNDWYTSSTNDRLVVAFSQFTG
jgi:hypothetical protein